MYCRMMSQVLLHVHSFVVTAITVKLDVSWGVPFREGQGFA